MKGIISEWGGTRKGIRYALAALGYEQSLIKPVGPQDPEHWAAFTVDLGVGNANAVRDVYQIYNEIQAVKEGSSRLACLTITLPTLSAHALARAALGPRMGSTAPPMHRERLPAAAIPAALGLGMRYSTVILPMAAPEGGMN